MASFWDNFMNLGNNQQGQQTQQVVNPSARLMNNQQQTIDNQPQFSQQPTTQQQYNQVNNVPNQQNQQGNQGQVNLEALFNDPFQNYNPSQGQSPSAQQQGMQGQMNIPQNPSQSAYGQVQPQGIQTQQTGTAQQQNTFTPVRDIDQSLAALDKRLQELSAKLSSPSDHYKNPDANANQAQYNKDTIEFQNLSRQYTDLSNRRTTSFQQQGQINQDMKRSAVSYLQSRLHSDMPQDLQNEVSGLFARMYSLKEQEGEFTKPEMFTPGGKEQAFNILYSLALGAAMNSRYEQSRSNPQFGNTGQQFNQGNQLQQQGQQPMEVLPGFDLGNATPRTAEMYKEWLNMRGSEGLSIADVQRNGEIERTITMLAGYGDGRLNQYLQQTPNAMNVYQRMQQNQQVDQVQRNRQFQDVNAMNQDFLSNANKMSNQQVQQQSYGQNQMYQPQQQNNQMQRPNQIPMNQGNRSW